MKKVLIIPFVLLAIFMYTVSVSATELYNSDFFTRVDKKEYVEHNKAIRVEGTEPLPEDIRKDLDKANEYINKDNLGVNSAVVFPMGIDLQTAHANAHGAYCVIRSGTESQGTYKYNASSSGGHPALSNWADSSVYLYRYFNDNKPTLDGSSIAWVGNRFLFRANNGQQTQLGDAYFNGTHYGTASKTGNSEAGVSIIIQIYNVTQNQVIKEGIVNSQYLPGHGTIAHYFPNVQFRDGHIYELRMFVRTSGLASTPTSMMSSMADVNYWNGSYGGRGINYDSTYIIWK